MPVFRKDLYRATFINSSSMTKFYCDKKTIVLNKMIKKSLHELELEV